MKEDSPPGTNSKMLETVGKLGGIAMISRMLGLIRVQLFASFFGVSYLSDAFFMAFRIPNLLRELIAEGAFLPAFITVIAQKRKRDGDAQAWRLVNRIVTTQVLILGTISFLGIIFAPTLVSWIVPHFDNEPGKIEITVTLTRILFPILLFVGLGASSTGILNIYGSFSVPAFASSFFNLGSIIVGVGLALILDPGFGLVGIICMAIGTLFGGFLQWFIQVPALIKLGFRYKPDFKVKEPAMIELGKLLTPSILGFSVAQVNVFINSIFASNFSGGVTFLELAMRIVQLPIGIFGASISTATLPSLAVAENPGNRSLFKIHLEQALRLNALLCIPSTCGLILLSDSLVQLLYRHGKFSLLSCHATSEILIAYSFGLIAYSSIKILSSAFYALKTVYTPLFIFLGSILFTTLMNWYLITKTHSGVMGLAITTSTTSLLAVLVMSIVLTKSLGKFSRAMFVAFIKIITASILMSGVIKISLLMQNQLYVNHITLGNITRISISTVLGALIFIWILRALKLEEVHQIERWTRDYFFKIRIKGIRRG
jgi:putative peptidoglycan lipid II flippase